MLVIFRKGLQSGMILFVAVCLFALSTMISPFTARAEDSSEEIVIDDWEVEVITEGTVSDQSTGVKIDVESGDQLEKIVGVVRSAKPSISYNYTMMPTKIIKSRKHGYEKNDLISVKNEDIVVASRTLGSEKKERVVRSRIGSKKMQRSQQGYLSPSIVSKVINRHLGGVKACYAKALKSNPNIYGRLYVKFTIGFDGRVSGVSKINSTVESSEMEQCILGSVLAWAFPEPKDGEVTIKHPFIFEQSN